MSTFSRVKEVLDKSIAAWSKRTGDDPFLGIHSIDFSWHSHEALLKATAFNLKLISEDLIGNGKAHETHLVMSLRSGARVGEHQFPRMPKGGPFCSDDDIADIEAWINGGCLPDEGCEE